MSLSVSAVALLLLSPARSHLPLRPHEAREAVHTVEHVIIQGPAVVHCTHCGPLSTGMPQTSPRSKVQRDTTVRCTPEGSEARFDRFLGGLQRFR